MVPSTLAWMDDSDQRRRWSGQLEHQRRADRNRELAFRRSLWLFDPDRKAPRSPCIYSFKIHRARVARTSRRNIAVTGS